MTVVFESGTFDCHTFRIPALVRTGAGTLLAFAEGRRNGAGDSGDIDLLVRRSVDEGESWSDPVVVLSHGSDTAGNPCPVVDRTSGDVVLLSTRNGGTTTEREILRGTVAWQDSRRVFVQRSSDDGVTWSEPTEITEDVKLPSWRWYATGPGHAIALRHGRFAGRLVAPANHSVPGLAPGSYGAHLLLSDDGGFHWRIGAVDPGTRGWVNPNESMAAELPTGEILVNARDQHGRNPANRAQAWSQDGGETFAEPFSPRPDLHAPVVQGSLLSVGDVLFFASPADPGKRVRMTVRVSKDGRGWWPAREISSLPAGYSDLVPMGGRIDPNSGTPENADGIGLLYETGQHSSYERLEFTAIRGML